MKTDLYLIIWGNANIDDRGASCAYCGCDKYFYNKEKALKALTTYKDNYIRELLEDADEEERFEIEDSIRVYGSEQEEYYEIDYMIFDTLSELYVKIQKIEVF